MQDQFLQLPDEIPFKKINYFNISDVKHKNNEFQIKITRKCQNLPEEKDYSIIRKLADFKWLKEKIEKENPQVIVTPNLLDSNWTFLQTLADKITDPFKNDERHRSNQYFQCRNIQRFLKLLSEVTLPHIYKIPGMNQSSLFTFLDTSFELYKLQSYQKTHSYKSLSSSSSLQTLAQTIGKGSIKLLGLLHVTKQPQKKLLQKQIQTFSKMQSQIKEFNKEVECIGKSLQTLCQNFLSEQGHIRQKQLQIYKIYLKSVGILRHITLVLNQMKAIIEKFQQLQTKVDRQFLNRQIEMYTGFVSKQSVKSVKQFHQVVEQLYKRLFQKNVSLKISSIYPSKY